jgi:uncharacterized protein YabE (DUF348 family)
LVDLKNFNAKGLQKVFSNHLRIAVLTVVLAVLVSVFASEMQKSVAIVVDGKPTKISTYKNTVGGVLRSAGIGLDKKDIVVPGINAELKSGMTIKVKKAIPVKIRISGKGQVIYTAENTIGDMLKAEGIAISKSDIVKPGIHSPVQKDMKITVTKVTEKTVTVKTNVAYKILSKTDISLEKGKVKVIRAGTPGQKKENYKVIYHDGKAVSRFKVGEALVKAAVDKIVAVGSLSWFTPSKGGRKIYYTKAFRVKATSYTADYACTGKRPGDRGFGVTATGTKARRNASGYSTVAVDRHTFPLGTKFYIEGYGYAIAEDVGGGVRGKHIDLYFNPGTQEYRSWFSHRVNVYVLN